MPQIARAYMLGDSQMIELPEDFHFEVDQVEVTQEGDTLILRPHVEKRDPWAALKELIEFGGSAEDFMRNGREQPETPEDRNWGEAFK